MSKDIKKENSKRFQFLGLI